VVSGPRVRFAIVGCGAVAAGHYLPALAASAAAEAALLVDRDRERARALAARWGVPAVAADPREVPGRAEAAVVALPNHLHAPVARELLAAGVHVLVEKPMALSTADCDAMIAAADAGGARLTVGLQFRFFDSTRLVADLLGSGLLGRLERFDLRLGVVSRWPFASDFVLRRESAGGGVLVDYGVHVLDLLLHWLGDWAEVRYRDDALGGLECDCELELAMRAGVAGRVEISRARDLANTCRFTCERGRLEVGIWDPDPPVVLALDGDEFALAGRARRPAATGSAGGGLDFTGAFRRQLDDFAAAVRGGREPAITGREGRRSIALIEACYAARAPLALPWVDPAQPAAG
jgi:predicted dehydrogenase